MLAKHLILPISRPQYVSVTEGFLNAVAWSVHVRLPSDPSGRKIGLQYRGVEKTGKKVKIQFSEPSSEHYEEISKRLQSLGVVGASEQNLGAKALVESILGVKPKRTKFYPASPMSPSLALLQNPEGIHATENPPPTAGILESIFQLGAPNGSTSTLAGLWLEAAEHRLELDPFLRALDTVVDECFFENKRKLKEKNAITIAQEYRQLTYNSPFSWFHASWVRLTSKEWVAALPARVWTDWATTLLRSGYGLAFLWESAWFESIAKSLVAGSGNTVLRVRENMEPTLPWKFSRQTLEIRDLTSRLRTRTHIASKTRTALESWLEIEGRNELSADEALGLMALDSDLVDRLKGILTTKPLRTDNVNLYEAIRYSLLTRETNELATDHYGFLRPAGRYLYADPGIEWISVVASLSSAKPSSSTHLGEVMRNLSMAGAKPDPRDLVLLLERAGLARGSADADHGVVVETAF